MALLTKPLATKRTISFSRGLNFAWGCAGGGSVREIVLTDSVDQYFDDYPYLMTIGIYVP